MTRYGGCGLALAGEIPFVSGDEIVQRFVVLAEKTIVDLTGWTVTAAVWVNGAPRVDIAVTVEIDTMAPASGGAHGGLRIVEAESAKLARSGPGFLRLTCVNDGRTMHTAGAGLREITGPAGSVSGIAILRCVLVGVRASDLTPVPPTNTYTDDDYAAFVAAA